MPGCRIKIEFTGVRPGEKLSEEVFDEHEQPQDSGVDGVNMVSADLTSLPNIRDIRQMIMNFERTALEGNDAAVREFLEVIDDRPPDPNEASNTSIAIRNADFSEAISLDRPLLKANRTLV